MKTFPSLLATLCAVGLASSALAQNATTTPVGAMTYTFPAVSASGDVTTYFTLTLESDPIYSATPSAIGTYTLTFSGASWTPNQFVTNPASYYVRIITGQQAGRFLKVTENTVDTLTVSITDDSANSTALNTANYTVTTSDVVELKQADTLASIFGDNISVNGTIQNPLVFVGASRATGADTVTILNKAASNANVTYFFNTTANQWRSTSSAVSMNNVPVFPDTAFAVVRRKSRSETSFVLTGRVTTTPTLQKTIATRSVPSALIFPVDLPLSSIQISGGWTKSTRATSADNLSVYNPSSGKFDTYYQRTDNTWRLSTNTTLDVSSTVIPAGSMVSLLDRVNETGAAAFFSIALPYSLN